MIAHDLRGMGRSDKPIQDVYTITQDAEDLDAVLSDTNVKRAVLVGHSKGGAVAIEYSLKHPEKVAALVLVSAFAKGSHLPVVDEDEERATLGDLVKREEYYNSSLGEELREKRPDIFRWAIHEGLKMPTYAALACARGFRRHWDASKEVNRISVPTLLVWGDRDFLTPLEPTQNYLLQKISGSKLAIIEGARHVPMLNDPQKFNSILHDFLLDCSGLN